MASHNDAQKLKLASRYHNSKTKTKNKTLLTFLNEGEITHCFFLIRKRKNVLYFDVHS